MTCAAAGHNGHLALRLLGGAVAAQAVSGIFDLIAVRRVDSPEHIVCIIRRCVENFFHSWPPFFHASANRISAM